MSSSASRNGSNTTADAASAGAAGLQAAIGYRFADPLLLHQALTHKSHSREHNERLEFLGDAVLGLVVAELIYAERPDANEDVMSLLRASLVRKETLAEIATELDLGRYLRLGAGVRKSGGHQIDSILADALEAVIGAVQIDGGMAAARQVVLAMLAERMRNLDPESLKDAKTRLQELLQGAGLELPAYRIDARGGTAHARTFTVSCRVEALNLEVSASGRSRRAAEKNAASDMLEAVIARLESGPLG